MNARKEYANLLSNLTESKNMLLTETDPDMKEMAREEVANCEKCIPELEENIKLMLIPKDPKIPKMQFWRFVEVQVVMRQLCLQVIYSECTLSTVNVKVGN